MSRTAPEVIGRMREPIQQALHAAVATLDDQRMQLIASYQLGWCDRDGNPVSAGGGKAIRPTLAVMSAQAGGGTVEDGLAAAAAVELVHNFSLLHDDVMDRDLERRHRPTGWAVYGEGQAILAGNAMLTCAIEVVAGDGSVGYPEFAPYDAISVGAAAPDVPAKLIDQLCESGRLVIPVGTRNDQSLMVVTKQGGAPNSRVATQCRFVPLRGAEGWR